MKAFVHISGHKPGLIPWGYFQNMLDGIKVGLDAIQHVPREEIFSEWLCELYLDELPTEEFNQVLSSINAHLLNLPTITASFANFWNAEILPLLEEDSRYRRVCSALKVKDTEGIQL